MHVTNTVNSISAASTPKTLCKLSADELLNGHTITMHDELDGDGDNCISMKRKDALWQQMHQPRFEVKCAPSLLQKQHQLHNILATVPAKPRIASTRRPVDRNAMDQKSDKSFPGRTSQPPQAYDVDSSAESEYAESFRRSRTSSLSFKRKYKPTTRPNLSSSNGPELCDVDERPHDKVGCIEADNVDDNNRIYESRVDKILKIMNTAETDYTKHRIRVTSKQSGSVKPSMLAVKASNDCKLPVPVPYDAVSNYSFYALIFMVMSNIVGVVLSLTYQVLLFLKINADCFLNKSWSHWQNVSIFGTENNIVTLLLLMPLILSVLLAYITIWAAYNLNRLMLTTVPDRLADMINFNIQIVN